MSVFRETRHLWNLVLLLILGGAGFVVVRGQLVPETYGDREGRYGPYRAAALEDAMAKPLVLISDATCHKCHEDVMHEREEAKHKSVRCYHCHGLAHEHVRLAEEAAKTPGKEIPPAEEWDGDFLTKIDLFVTQDRKTCLVCHESIIGMPKDFQQIVVAEHLEEQGADEVESPNVCFECHGGHDTAP